MPGGTSGDVVVTLGASISRLGLAVYALGGVQATGVSGGGTGNTATASLSPTSAGAGLAVAYSSRAANQRLASGSGTTASGALSIVDTMATDGTSAWSAWRPTSMR